MNFQGCDWPVICLRYARSKSHHDRLARTVGMQWQCVLDSQRRADMIHASIVWKDQVGSDERTWKLTFDRNTQSNATRESSRRFLYGLHRHYFAIEFYLSVPDRLNGFIPVECDMKGQSRCCGAATSCGRPSGRLDISTCHLPCPGGCPVNSIGHGTR